MEIKDFDEWLKTLIYPGDVEDFVEVLYDGGEGFGDGTIKVKKQVAVYTGQNKYFITAVERDETKGYLGCQVEARKPRAGETWKRGNDLADGPFTKETLEQIKNRIIAYELVQLSVRVPQKTIVETPEDQKDVVCNCAEVGEECDICGGK